MADFVDLAFTLAFRYRNPAMILSDGVIGQMMERVVLPEYKPRRTEEEIKRECPWASIGRTKGRKPNILTSLELKPEEMEADLEGLQTMEILGNNMAYFLKCMVAGNPEGVERPVYQEHILTNFVR